MWWNCSLSRLICNKHPKFRVEIHLTSLHTSPNTSDLDIINNNAMSYVPPVQYVNGVPVQTVVQPMAAYPPVQTAVMPAVGVQPVAYAPQTYIAGQTTTTHSIPQSQQHGIAPPGKIRVVTSPTFSSRNKEVDVISRFCRSSRYGSSSWRT